MKLNRGGGSHEPPAVDEKIKKRHKDKLEREDRKRHNSRKNNADKTKIQSPSKRTLCIICVVIAAVSVISIAVVLKGASDERSYHSYFSQAQEYYYSADYGNALSYLRKASHINKTDESLLMMSDCYIAQGNMEKALEILRGMDVKNPEIADKIASIEEARSALDASEKVWVAGQQYPKDASNLILDNSGLTEKNLEEIAQLYALSNLSVSENGLRDISALSDLRGLTALNLAKNEISDISSLSALSGLRTLYLDSNPIKDFTPLESLINLTTLSIKNIEITQEQLAALSASLPNCAIHSETAEENVLDISFGGITFTSDVTEINLSNMGITDISVLSSCKGLKTLDLSGNYISDIRPLMDIPGLEWLNIEGNRITDLRPLMGISSLKVINAENNNIRDIAALGSLTSLTELYLGNNPISDFSALSKLAALTTLGLENTGLDDSGLSEVDKVPNLTILMINDNPELTGNAVDAFKQTNLHCRVYNSDLTYMVELGGQQFRDDITELNASKLGLSDIAALGEFDYLEKVDLSGNNISNIYIFQWLDSVRELDLSGNCITDITAVASMGQLEVLDLSDNTVDGLTPLYYLQNLRELHLDGNGIDSEQIDKLKTYLPDCKIYS